MRYFKDALDLFYHQSYMGKKFSEMADNDLDLPKSVCWHLYSLILLDRMASQYARFDYLDYNPIIKKYNSFPKEKRMRVKYVFTSHPTQPNSMEQLHYISKIFKGLEQNDSNFLCHAIKNFILSCNNRLFKKPTYLEESETYHREYLTNMIKALSRIYELGLKEPSDFFETPGTWLTFDFDNHPEMEVGIMTYTHGLCINLTIEEYLDMFKEAGIHDLPVLSYSFSLFHEAQEYSKKLMEISKMLQEKKIKISEFYKKFPKINLYEIEKKIIKDLEIFSLSEEYGKKLNSVSLKIIKLLEVFHLSGCIGQIRLSGESVWEMKNIPNIIFEIMEEISLLNQNGVAADMVIIANYEQNIQYQNVEALLCKYNIKNIEIVPLLETFASTNETVSKITMIASSDTRQRDGLLLTELRTFKEYTSNPNKFIFMGQGITAERGGGPYTLVHKKYNSLTKAQRIRHIRTIQGHYFASEFASSDLAFTFLMIGSDNINKGEHFEPSKEYMEFLFELDNIVGVPQRELQKTNDFNSFYVKNNIIRTLTESFNYAGSREKGKNLINVKNERAIVQAYINSDRCSFTHPELAYWDRVNNDMIRKMAKFYYENNPHFNYVLFMYAFMIKRFNLEFAKDEIGVDTDSISYKAYYEGKKSLEKILNFLGVGQDCIPLTEIWNQHLGISKESSIEESKQKENSMIMFVKIQNFFVKKYLKDEMIGLNSEESLYKLRIMQSGLANISPSNGKG